MKIIVEAESSNKPIEYALFTPDGESVRDWQSIGVFEDVEYGKYHVHVRDAIQAEDSQSVTVEDRNAPTLTDASVSISRITKEGFTVSFAPADAGGQTVKYLAFASTDSITDASGLDPIVQNTDASDMKITGFESGDEVHVIIEARDPFGNSTFYESFSQVTADLEIISVEVV